MTLRDRAAGSLLGLALGDALGAPFEFRRAKDIPTPLPAFELPWAGGPAGSTTDDTAMARNLARSLVERGGFDPDDVVRRHLEWLATDPPDVGILTRRVLGRAAAGESAVDAARAIWEERGPEVSAGNGSVMYCAPLGAAYARRPQELDELAPLLSSLTHFDPRCGTACLAICVAVAAVVRGEDRVRAVRFAVAHVLDRPAGEELEYLVDAAGEARPVDGPDRGFCLFAAALGLQALARGGTFQEELTRIVRLGGDTDTNGAVAGAVVGAAVGHAGLPAEWLDRLQDRDGLEREGSALGSLAESLD
jgi:ADP-ribosyl-[dinitrogen reductase] hydrolase